VLLHRFLKARVRFGRLAVVYADGHVGNYGDGEGRPVAARITRRGERRIVRDPTIGLGEAYMEGDLDFDTGDIGSLIELIGRNIPHDVPVQRGPVQRAWIKFLHRLRQRNDRTRAATNVHHHYDLSLALYRRFLDDDLQYSCGYFARGDMSLDEAQSAKKSHIAAKLALKPGMRVLDIGCGWGGLALSLVRDYGVDVLGITLSQEQLDVAQARARAQGLGDRARFALTDYRELSGSYDRIVSVGMFEHVGEPNYRCFFQTLAARLTDDGVALVHSIGRRDPPDVTAPFIRKYIFPGGYIPALSETLSAVEESGLWATDIEILRLHYAQTLRHWRERFASERAQVAMLYDERFCRMWEFYLTISEMSFRIGGHMNFQLQLAKRVETLPLTRDYMVDVERAQAQGGRRRARA